MECLTLMWEKPDITAMSAVACFRYHLPNYWLSRSIYTRAINQTEMKSFFAWPPCGYFVNKHIILWSYKEHRLTIMTLYMLYLIKKFMVERKDRFRFVTCLLPVTCRLIRLFIILFLFRLDKKEPHVTGYSRIWYSCVFTNT